MYIYTRDKKYHYIYRKVWDKKSKKNTTIKFYLGVEPVNFNRGLEMKIENVFGPISEKVRSWLEEHCVQKDRFIKRSVAEEERIKSIQEEEKSNRDASRVLNRIIELGSAL